MLRRLVEDGKPDQFAVVFDAPGKTFRDDWYPQYKATRTAMPDDLAQQIEPLHELIRAYGWPLLMINGVEADDVIGTLVRRAETEGLDAVISTGDKDLAQLITPRVTLVNTMSNEKLDMQSVVAKFGVRADQILDLLTLTCDAVDNVPGVAKVGPKTAAKWLAEYGTLDQVIAHAGDIGGVVGQNLRTALDWLPQGRRLLTVRRDCELGVKVAELTLGEPAAERLRELYERFEFKSWLGEFARGERETHVAAKQRTLEPQAVADPQRPATAPAPRVEYETVRTQDALARWLAAIAGADLVSFDTTTTTADPMSAEIVGLSFAIEAAAGGYVPLAHRYAGVPDQLDAASVLRSLTPWFEDAMRAKLGHNVKYAQHALANHGIAIAGIAHDTELESYIF